MAKNFSITKYIEPTIPGSLFYLCKAYYKNREKSIKSHLSTLLLQSRKICAILQTSIKNKQSKCLRLKLPIANTRGFLSTIALLALERCKC